MKTLIYCINERHSIYIRKEILNERPWSSDNVFDAPFPNVFRQLDPTTIALNEMLAGHRNKVFNILWFRMFNRKEHAKNLGFCEDVPKLERYMRSCDKPFSASHSRRGTLDETLAVIRAAYQFSNLMEDICRMDSLETIYNSLTDFKYIGKFHAYQMALDCGHNIMKNPKDALTWCVLPPPAVRFILALKNYNVESVAPSGPGALHEAWGKWKTEPKRQRGALKKAGALLEYLRSEKVFSAAVEKQKHNFEMSELVRGIMLRDRYLRCYTTKTA